MTSFKDENLFNWNPSMILGCFDIDGKPFERVDYSPNESAMRKITSGSMKYENIRDGWKWWDDWF